MKTDVAVRNELKKILSQVTNLSQQVSASLEKDEPIVDLSNEMVKSAVAFTFHLGHLYALETKLNQPAVVSKQAKAPRSAVAVNARYHNLRDPKGRFAPKHVAVALP